MASNPSVPSPHSRPPQLSQVTSPLSSQSVPESVPLSEGRRLAYTFFAPSKTFTDLRRDASWWAPWLIIAIVGLLFVYVIDQKVGFQKVSENLIQLRPKQAERIDNMPADQRQRIMQQQATIAKGISYAVPVIALLVYAVFAGVLFATLKFAGGSDLKYKTLFALIVYTRLPEVLMSVLAMFSLLAGVSGDGFNIQNPLATNPGYFVGPDGSPVVRALLTPLDVFTIWTLILTAFAIVFGWFAFIVLARVGLAAASS